MIGYVNTMMFVMVLTESRHLRQKAKDVSVAKTDLTFEISVVFIPPRETPFIYGYLPTIHTLSCNMFVFSGTAITL